MAMTFGKARREQVKIRVSISGPAGSGKTMSSLLLAYGLVKSENPGMSDEDIWDKICIIDTECGSGSLYVGQQVGTTTIGAYNTIPLVAPFEPAVFVDAIHMAEEHKMSVIIIDSLSHAWAGAGGALDQQGKIADRSGNSWSAWRTITPQHNKLVDAMLQSSAHVIACMRAKMEYQQVVGDNGKKQIKAMGMGVVMKEGIEYEFGVSFMLDYNHVANATKDRTGMFDGKLFTIDPSTGVMIHEWLASAKPIAQTAQSRDIAEPKKADPSEAPAVDPEQLKKAIDAVDALIQPLVKDADKETKAAVAEKIKSIIGIANYKKATDINKLRELYKAFKE